MPHRPIKLTQSLVEQYDDLPVSMIQSLMTSTCEKADIPFVMKKQS